MLRPTANLFAVADEDPKSLEALEQRLRSEGDFTDVWTPAPGWVAGQALLPESVPDGEDVRGAGFAFIEGRDRLEAGGPRWPARLSQAVDQAPEQLAEFPGDFAFLRFRGGGDGLAVRSCAGLAPIYFFPRPEGGLALATLLSFFPRFLPEPFLADPLMNAAWAAAQFIDQRTYVEGVSIIPPGSYAEFDTARVKRIRRYWDPRPRQGQTLRPDPERPRRLRALLLNTLERDLDPKGRNLLALSGGVDSSSLAALIGGTLGWRLSSWSLLSADDLFRARELSYIEPLVETFGIEPSHRPELDSESVERWVLESPGLPFQVVQPFLCELPRLAQGQEVRVLVGGEFADEVCGDWSRMVDWAQQTSLRQLIARPRALPYGPRDYLRWARRRVERSLGRPLREGHDRLPAWAPMEVCAEFEEWLDRRRRALAGDRRPLIELAEAVAADKWVAANWEGTTPVGIRRSLPFFNREILELAFECHPHDLLGPGPKRLLRNALREDVPERNLFRPDGGLWKEEVRVDWEPALKSRFRTVPPEIVAGIADVNRLPALRSDQFFGEVSALVRALGVAAHLHESAAGGPAWPDS